MRVLYYHQHFSTPRGAGGTRSYEVARRLVEQGHAVTIACGAYAMGDTGLRTAFTRGRREGVVDGIRVIEFQLSYSNHDPFLKRSLTFMRYALRSVMLALRERYDVVLASSTPLTAALPGIAARWLRRKPFVFEVRDLWPELPRAMGVIRNPVVLLLLSGLELVAYRSAVRCVALSPGIAQGIVRRGIAPGRVVTIPNAADLDLFRSDPAVPLPDLPGVQPGDFVAAFTGAHGIANGLGAVLDAAAVLERRGVRHIRLLFIGDGREKPALEARARAEGLAQCHFMDPLPKRDLAQLLCRRVNVGLMILANVPAFYFGTSPNKFFDYLASGLPVLVNYPGWMADMVTTEGLGRTVPPDDPAAFADALCEMSDNAGALAEMRRRSRALAERQFARDTLARELIDVLASAYRSVAAEGRAIGEKE
jgi:glycosyltransferase involved in cell wall biosynthesis